MNLFVLPALYLRFGRPRKGGRDWRDEPRIRRTRPPAPKPAPQRERVPDVLTVMQERPSDATA